MPPPRLWSKNPVKYKDHALSKLLNYRFFQAFRDIQQKRQRILWSIGRPLDWRVTAPRGSIGKA